MPKCQKDSNYKTGRTAQVIRWKESRRHIPHGTYHSFQSLAKLFENDLGNSPSLSGLKNGTTIGWVLESETLVLIEKGKTSKGESDTAAVGESE